MSAPIWWTEILVLATKWMRAFFLLSVSTICGQEIWVREQKFLELSEPPSLGEAWGRRPASEVGSWGTPRQGNSSLRCSCDRWFHLPLSTLFHTTSLKVWILGSIFAPTSFQILRPTLPSSTHLTKPASCPWSVLACSTRHGTHHILLIKMG